MNQKTLQLQQDPCLLDLGPRSDPNKIKDSIKVHILTIFLSSKFVGWSH